MQAEVSPCLPSQPLPLCLHTCTVPTSPWDITHSSYIWCHSWHSYLPPGEEPLVDSGSTHAISPSMFINKMHEGGGCPQCPLSSKANLGFPSRWFLEKYRNSELLQSCMLTCIKGHAFKREGLQRKCEARPHHAVWWIQNLFVGVFVKTHANHHIHK